MSKDIRIYAQQEGGTAGQVPTATGAPATTKIVVTSNGKQAYATEITSDGQVGKIKQIPLAKFQDDLLTSVWKVTQDRCDIGDLHERDFLALLARVWNGSDMADTGVMPAIGDQKWVAKSLQTCATEFGLAIAGANKDMLAKWLLSNGVWRKTTGCWF